MSTTNHQSLSSNLVGQKVMVTVGTISQHKVYQGQIRAVWIEQSVGELMAFVVYQDDTNIIATYKGTSEQANRLTYL